MNHDKIKQFHEKRQRYEDLTPNERLILASLELSRIYTGKEVYSLLEISHLTCIAKTRIYYYVKNLAEKDYIDMTDFGHMKQVILKNYCIKL
jgi:hypothetical protein